MFNNLCNAVQLGQSSVLKNFKINKVKIKISRKNKRLQFLNTLFITIVLCSIQRKTIENNSFLSSGFLCLFICSPYESILLISTINKQKKLFFPFQSKPVLWKNVLPDTISFSTQFFFMVISVYFFKSTSKQKKQTSTQFRQYGPYYINLRTKTIPTDEPTENSLVCMYFRFIHKASDIRANRTNIYHCNTNT